MYFLYNHGGSENHGCEALIRTVSALFDKDIKPVLLSDSPQQDFHYEIDKVAEIRSARQYVSKVSLDFLKAYIRLKRTGDYFDMDILPYRKSIKSLSRDDVEISVGGDVYCYEDYCKYIRLHKLISEKDCRSVLLGCSLEERLFNDPSFVEDMRRYDYISARETITYGYLKNAGLTNIGYAPDTAFTLPVEMLPLPKAFQEFNTVGINLSPLASGKESREGIALENFRQLIQFILDHTDCSIALIPHVIWKGNDDRTVLDSLYEEFAHTGRIVMIHDCSCTQLKGYISRCRLFVGARTHATIAAYSTCVPTLVLGYSIKSRGIAKDLFGTDTNYVIPVQGLKNENDLTDAFRWILDHESDIREHLSHMMPDYIAKTASIMPEIEKITRR